MKLLAHFRKLHFGAVVWGWRPGRSGVRFQAPDGHRFFVRWERITGMSTYDVDRGTRKRTFAVGPDEAISEQEAGGGGCVMKLITVHSLRGGAGRTTLALRKAREAGPGTVLIETDLTGTSLCDVLPLRAPDLGSLPDETLKLTQVPRSWHSTAESRARMELRHRSALQGTRLHHLWGLPFLNDWLLFTPEQDTRAGDARAEALLWREDPDLGLRIIPASPLPHDQLAMQVFSDEPRTGFVESRLEFLVAALLRAGVSTIVFDTGRGFGGFAGAVLSLALRLAHQQPLAVDGVLAPPLDRVPLEVEVLLLSEGDGPALDRWLALCPNEERALITVVPRERGEGQRLSTPACAPCRRCSMAGGQHKGWCRDR